MKTFFGTATGLTAAALLLAASTGHANADDAMREKAAANFEQADTNADGALTRDEFKTLIDLNAEDRIGRARTVKRFGKYRMAFEKVDGNADGLLTTEELSKAASKNR